MKLSAEETINFDLFDNIPLGVFVLRSDFIVLFWNNILEEWTGIPSEKIVGSSIETHFPNLLHREYVHRLENIFTGGVPVIFSYQYHRHLIPSPLLDGTLRVQHTTVTAVKTADDTSHALFTIEDVTDLSQLIQKYSELHEQTLREIEEMKALNAQILQSRKMEAVGQLASGIAHDLNNILTAIFGYSDVILMRMEDGDKSRKYVEKVLASGKRAADLTNGLLALSSRQVLDTKPLSLSGVLQEHLDTLRMLVREDIDLKIKCVERELVVMADKGQIEQVLINLVSNARDAMPKVGAMTIELSPAIIDDEFIHLYGYGEPGNYACLSVADTGNGMDEETKEKIFEPFFTTKEVGKRSGLGLAVVYGIVKQHNGFIGVFSEEGKGTTFRVYLPLIYDKITDSNKIMSETTSAGGTETVLLAEDDAILRELNRLILSSAGYSVIEAVDGEDALNKFMVHQNEIDILTFDVIMPKIDGKKAYEEISKVRPELKVIFMSGYAKDIIDRECFMKDEVNFMAKPLMPSDLLNMVRYLLDN